MVGFIDFKKPLKIIWIGYLHALQDFLNLQRLIANVEINLVPLQNNVFTNCKSELKYFEAGIVGTVSIASPIFSYKKVIADKENGYLSNSYEWCEKLAALIKNINDLPEISLNAFHDSQDKYAYYNQENLFRKLF